MKIRNSLPLVSTTGYETNHAGALAKISQLQFESRPSEIAFKKEAPMEPVKQAIFFYKQDTPPELDQFQKTLAR
jgi:hypothetical protein